MPKILYVTTLTRTLNAFFVPQLLALAADGFTVEVAASPDVPLDARLAGVVAYHPIAIPRGVSAGGMARATLALRRLMAEEQYDLVQYSTPNAALCAALAARQAGVKVRNYHLMGFRYLGFEGAKRRLFCGLEQLTCRLSTHVECITQSNLQLGIREGIFPPEKVTVVWNGSTGGVDTARFTPEKRDEWRQALRHELEIGGDEFVYLFVGRVTRDKGVNELLKAFFSLTVPARLLLVGNQEDVATVDAVLWQRALSDPRILTQAPVTDIERWFAAADVLVLPSYREGFGNVVIEAGSVGTPSIVSDIPGPGEIVDHIGGQKCTVRDAEALRAAMEQAFTQRGQVSPEEIHRAAAACYDSGELCRRICQRKRELLQLPPKESA